MAFPYGSNCIELYGATPYIDFHYGNSTADYTSRIITGVSGQLNITGNLAVDNGYTDSHSYKLYVGGTGYFLGAVTMASTLAVTGATTLASTLKVSGAATLSSTLAVTGAVTGSSTIYAKTGIYSDGYVSAMGQNTSSDIRLKNIKERVRLRLKDLARAPLFRFTWKGREDGGADIGSSAQYWQGVLPEAVKERHGFLEMQYGNIALAGVISLARETESLEQRVARLEKENARLKARLRQEKIYV